jgi:hypothetical protein
MAKAKPRTATDEALRATLEFPLADPLPASYIARETGDLKARLDRDATYVFRRFHAGLLRDRATLPCGRPVVSKADALRWLFATLASATFAKQVGE